MARMTVLEMTSCECDAPHVFRSWGDPAQRLRASSGTRGYSEEENDE